ncbi:MAG: hypothetical protein H6605_00710 [Flavobacteriales bacterium]|nr:hypothetical protein [Flavobacteriales bacterium]
MQIKLRVLKKYRQWLWIYLIAMMVLTIPETGCRAKSCPAYGDESPKRKRLFKRKKRSRNGLFHKRQRRYY